MLTINLKDAMEEYHRREGKRITYKQLGRKTGISDSTLRKIGASLTYHTTLANIEKICLALEVTPGFLLEIIKDPGKRKRKSKAKKKKS